MEETQGTSALLAQIYKRANDAIDFKVTNSILGYIQGTSLKLDNFDEPIPRSDYLVLQSSNPLEDGSRVLCIPTDGGRTFVVAGRVI